MLLLVSDENFNNDIVRGLLRRKPDLDIIRVQDVGLRSQDDLTILEWAAQERRVVLTHDAATMTYFAYERVRAGKSIPCQTLTLFSLSS
jgi:predicted nuclease of predicted toxin-antitoxin system